MTPGYIEFEFDLAGALFARLVEVFAGLNPAPLTPAILANVPEAQGVYQLFLDHDAGEPELVYIGKTDAATGLHDRLSRHSQKVQHRVGLDPSKVLFKAVRIFVFTPLDLEAQLIEHYGGTPWNGSGFGSNDPGRQRDTTTYKPEHFDAQYPIDIRRTVDFDVPLAGSAADILTVLKRKLPYLVRFERVGRSSRAHPDLATTNVNIDPSEGLTPENILKQVVAQLPKGWHATMLPSHVIMYKNDQRSFPSGKLLARS
jgi:hypothetical protein